MSSKDDIFVTYGDVSIYKSDLNWLNPGQWLNDAIISAMFEFYSREQFKEEVSNGFLYFLSPAVVALLTFLEGNLCVSEKMCQQMKRKKKMMKERNYC